jgi:hypothetical protein
LAFYWYTQEEIMQGSAAFCDYTGLPKWRHPFSADHRMAPSSRVFGCCSTVGGFTMHLTLYVDQAVVAGTFIEDTS